MALFWKFIPLLHGTCDSDLSEASVEGQRAGGVHSGARTGGGHSSFVLLPVATAKGPVEETTAAHSPAGSEPHLPVQDTGQERIFFRQGSVSCCSVT